METVEVKFCWLHSNVGDLQLPRYATAGAAGMDVGADVSEPVTIEPGEIALIPTGFAVALKSGYEMQVRPRSGLAVKYGITIVNSPGTIDADYRGEVKIALINHGKNIFTVKRGDRIAQLVLAPVSTVHFVEVTELSPTQRNSGGFGHTGRQ